MKTKSIKKYRSVGGKKIKNVMSKKKISNKKDISSKSLKKLEDISSNSLKKCEDTICTKYVNDGLEFTEEYMTKAIKAGKKIMVEDPDLEKRKRAKISVKGLIKAKKEMSSPKYLNNEMKFCKKLYCNPTCADIIVDGIVEDGFNKKLDPNEVKKLKRKGGYFWMYLCVVFTRINNCCCISSICLVRIIYFRYK